MFKLLIEKSGEMIAISYPFHLSRFRRTAQGLTGNTSPHYYVIRSIILLLPANSVAQILFSQIPIR